MAPTKVVTSSTQGASKVLMMKRIWSAGIPSLLLAAVACLAADPVDLKPVLKGVEDRYNKIQTLEVQFTQSSTSKGRTHTDSGTLYLRKKGKMRWEYASGTLFVSDGKFIYSYYPEEHRAEKMTMKATDDMRAPLAFLLGDVNFDRDFGSYETKAQDGGVLIRALPKSDKFPYTEVTFLVAPDATIRRLQVKLQTNDLIVFTFEGEKKNPLLSDALFQFTAPKGTEIDDLTR